MNHCEDCGRESNDLQTEVGYNADLKLCPVCRYNYFQFSGSLLDKMSEEPKKPSTPVQPAPPPPEASDPAMETVRVTPRWVEYLIKLWPWAGRNR